MSWKRKIQQRLLSNSNDQKYQNNDNNDNISINSQINEIETEIKELEAQKRLIQNRYHKTKNQINKSRKLRTQINDLKEKKDNLLSKKQDNKAIKRKTNKYLQYTKKIKTKKTKPKLPKSDPPPLPILTLINKSNHTDNDNNNNNIRPQTPSLSQSITLGQIEEDDIVLPPNNLPDTFFNKTRSSSSFSFHHLTKTSSITGPGPVISPLSSYSQNLLKMTNNDAIGSHIQMSPYKQRISILPFKDDDESETDAHPAASRVYNNSAYNSQELSLDLLVGINSLPHNRARSAYSLSNKYTDRDESISRSRQSGPITLTNSKTGLCSTDSIVDIIDINDNDIDINIDIDDGNKSDNEFVEQFENVYLGSAFKIINYNDDDDDDDDIIYSNQSKFCLDRNLIIESIIDIYSYTLNEWMTVAAILNGNILYLVSAKQFQIYQEFVERTKINEIMVEHDRNDNNISKNIHGISVSDDDDDDDLDLNINGIDGKMDDNDDDDDDNNDDDKLAINGTLINMKDAEEMFQNLKLRKIGKNNNEENEIAKHKIFDFLVGKTKYDIERHILLNISPITSLSSLFGINDNDIGCIKHIRILGFGNKNILSTDKLLDDFIDELMGDIIYIEQEVQGNTLVITFEDYLYPQDIDNIRNKMHNFGVNTLKLNKQQLSLLQIQPYYGHLVKESINRIVMCDLSNKYYDHVKPFDLKQYYGEYGFQLKTNSNMNDNDIKLDKTTITCLLKSNNMRHAWIAHLDYILSKSKDNNNNNNNININVIDSDYDGSEDEKDTIAPLITSGLPAVPIAILKRKLSNKFANDFGYDSDATSYITDNTTDLDNDDNIDHKDDEFVHHFGFGVKFNYYQKHFEYSVIPKYLTLKNELINNTIYPLDINQYNYLYRKSIKLIPSYFVQKLYLAKYIGINNIKCGISVGSKLTVNHLITLIAYTDFTELPSAFKKQCRRLNDTESILKFKLRNSNIANWCRYLRECCLFYGTLMTFRQHFYTGLSRKLIFLSLTQPFECPISTTAQKSIAQNFSDDIGIILKLIAGNTSTKYFDTTWLSKYNQEKERLIMGCSLKIYDIMYPTSDGLMSTKDWIAALQLFEKIISGHSFSWVKSLNKKVPTQQYLRYLIDHYKLINNKSPKYIQILFNNMIKNNLINNNKSNRCIWLNKSELKKLKHKALKKLFWDFDENKCGNFLKKFNIKNDQISWIKEFKWKINGMNYLLFKNLKQRKFIQSAEYQYILPNNNGIIRFHLQLLAKYSYKYPECALFFELKKLPQNIHGIRISIERICRECNYQNIMSAQWLGGTKNSCGSRVFPTKKLQNKKSLTWIIAIKLLQSQ